jgi:hypothetical protein
LDGHGCLLLINRIWKSTWTRLLHIY